MTDPAEAPISLTCADCGHAFRVRGRAAGRSVKCPGCATPIDVPGPYDLPPLPPPTPTPTPTPTPAMPSFAVAAAVTPESTNQRAEPIKPAEEPKVNAIREAFGALGPFRATTPKASSDLPDRRSYPTLVVIALLLRLLAIGTVCVAVLVIGGMSPGGNAPPAAATSWFILAMAIGTMATVSAVVLFALAELIHLAIHVQCNTLAAARSAHA